MKYLESKKGSRKAHIWDDYSGDTVCKMYSTGGMNKNNYKVVDETKKQICSMCRSNTKSSQTKAKKKENRFNTVLKLIRKLNQVDRDRIKDLLNGLVSEEEMEEGLDDQLLTEINDKGY